MDKLKEIWEKIKNFNYHDPKEKLWATVIATYSFLIIGFLSFLLGSIAIYAIFVLGSIGVGIWAEHQYKSYLKAENEKIKEFEIVVIYRTSILLATLGFLMFLTAPNLIFGILFLLLFGLPAFLLYRMEKKRQKVIGMLDEMVDQAEETSDEIEKREVDELKDKVRKL